MPFGTALRCRALRWLWRAGMIGVVLLVAGSASAHNPDTSYARFTVEPKRFEAKFTYDLFTLLRIAPQLDANADHQVTPAELQAHVPAVYAYLASHIALKIDDAATTFGEPQPVAFPAGMGDAIVEKDYHAAGALVYFTFQKPLVAPMIDFWVQFEFFNELGDRHTVLGAIADDGHEYEVLFRRWEPDYLFDTSYEPPKPPAGDALAKAAIPNSVVSNAPAAGSSMPAAAPATAAPTETSATPATTAPASTIESSGRRGRPGMWQQITSFFWLGVEHIFLGYDHILFLLSLLIISRLGELVKIVTSFTVAHTVTLILATLDVVQLPSRLVESAIAATIVYVAIENFWVKNTSHRWRLTFVFGLVHGFGFAGVLRELGLPTEGLMRSLVAFNVGVEAGQLAIVCLLFIPMTLIARWRYGKYVQNILSAAIALCGLCWLVDRVFALDMMPF